MTIESSRRRAMWRWGSVLAATAGSVVVTAVVARRRTRPTGRPAVAGSSPAVVPRPVVGDGTTPGPGGKGEARAEPVPLGVPDDVTDADLDLDPSLPTPARPVERRRWPLVATALAAVVVITLVAAVAGLGGGEGPDTTAASENPATTAPEPSTTTVEDLTPAEAFAQASRRLETAGSFAYNGTSLATDVSPVRPGVWLAVELSVAGEVDLGSGRLHEIGAVPNGRVSETVTNGLQVWGRLADDQDDLADERFLTVGQPRATSRRFGAALLPSWLVASVDRVELPGGEAGRRRFRATIPAEVVGEIEDDRDPVTSEVVLTLDEAGDPVHVEVTSAPEGPRLQLVFDITRLGDPMPITLPGETPG